MDPTCGSGTFLFHAARRILASPASEGLPPAKQAAAVSMLVNGIDVHPVAAELARATLLRALPAPPPDGEASLRIYQGDALLARAGQRIHAPWLEGGLHPDHHTAAPRSGTAPVFRCESGLCRRSEAHDRSGTRARLGEPAQGHSREHSGIGPDGAAEVLHCI